MLCLWRTLRERPSSQAGRSRLGPFLSLFVLKPYSPMEYPVSNPAPFVPIGRRLWMQMELPAGRRVLPESTTLSASNSQHQRVQPLIEKIPILRTCGNPRWTFTPTRNFPNSPIHRLQFRNTNGDIYFGGNNPLGQPVEIQDGRRLQKRTSIGLCR